MKKSLKTPLLWSVLSRTKRSGGWGRLSPLLWRGWGRLSLFLLPLLIASKCFKEPEPTDPIDQLPPATQTGENTFGCLVDGEVYLPRGGAIGTGVPALSMSYGNKSLSIKSNNSKTKETIGFGIKGIEYVPQNIILSFSKNPWLSATYINSSNTYFIDSTSHIGELIITRFDTVENIVSGTFWFDAVNENDSTDVVQIREGRFDLR